MHMKPLLGVIAAVGLAGAFGSASDAQTGDGDLSFSLGLTVSNSDNIAFLSGAGVSSDDDSSITLRGSANGKWQIGDNGRLSLDYAFSGTRYSAIGSRDNNLHLGTATYTHRVGVSVLGGSYAIGRYQLDGEDFLEIDVASLFFGTPGPWGWVLVGRYTATEKTFDAALSERDASADSVGISASRRFGDTRIRLELSQAGEDASSDFLDNNSTTVSINLSQPLRLIDQPLRLSLTAGISERSYDRLDPYYGVTREDTRRRYQAALSREFDSGLSITGSASHLDSSSNLPSANYDQTIISFSINQRF